MPLAKGSMTQKMIKKHFTIMYIDFFEICSELMTLGSSGAGHVCTCTWAGEVFKKQWHEQIPSPLTVYPFVYFKLKAGGKLKGRVSLGYQIESGTRLK